MSAFFRTAAMWLSARLYLMERDTNGTKDTESIGALIGELDAACELRIMVRERRAEC